MIALDNPSTEELVTTDTVYIVEDDESTREALGELIRPTGAKVVTYGSAEEFLQNVDSDQPSCLLLDHQLPGMNGCELLRQLRNDNLQMPAVLVTAYATTSMAVDAMRMGAVNVLEKPCCENQLRDAIDQALALGRKEATRNATRRELAARIEGLSDNERAVLKYVLDGVPNKQIASLMNVCIRTIEARRSRIYKSMGVQSVAELTRSCVAAGFIDS
ncbi:response regulator transcription factor [Aeoliella mucimassa]|uniref:Response regulator protein TmoT n=1 Tax=Aeoliella mucimassa TaxID=2527972 RepID=A0A518AL64_9BACT|nr:response regulator [Aeoliella mucimassa]QDU55478.1 Response regulator protein TmoT [Aeoliella mucimassa]